jgi:hypothetical protein
MTKPISQYSKGTEHGLLVIALEDKVAGRITQAELSSQCYLWTYHYALPDLKYRPFPPIPRFMVEFYRLTEETQRKILNREGERADKVRNHLNRVYRIKVENRVHKEWLEEMLAYFEKEKMEEKVKTVRRMVNELS